MLDKRKKVLYINKDDYIYLYSLGREGSKLAVGRGNEENIREERMRLKKRPCSGVSTPRGKDKRSIQSLYR